MATFSLVQIQYTGQKKDLKYFVISQLFIIFVKQTLRGSGQVPRESHKLENRIDTGDRNKNF